LAYGIQVIESPLLDVHATFLFPCISDHKRYKIIKSNDFMNFKEAFMVFSRF